MAACLMPESMVAQVVARLVAGAQRRVELRAQAGVLQREVSRQREALRALAEVLQQEASRAQVELRAPEEVLQQEASRPQVERRAPAEVLQQADSRRPVAVRRPVAPRQLVALRQRVARAAAERVTWVAAPARPVLERCGCSRSSSFVVAACPI